jgi:opacity protein-like surface antigen
VKKVIVFAMLAVLAATPVFADKGEFWFGLNGGISGPQGDFSDAADMGFHGTLTTIYFLTPVLGIGADVGYHWWSAKDEFNDGLKALDEFVGATPPSGAEASFSSVQATAQATFMIPMEGKTRPYLTGGLGIYNTKFKIEDSEFIDGEDSSSDFGYNLGGGINWMVSPMYQVGIGAAYHSIQGDEADLGTLNFYTVGINLLWGKGGGQ